MLSAMATPPRIRWAPHGRTEPRRAANRSASGHRDEDGVPTGGPVRGRRRLGRRLGVAGAVRGPDLDLALTGRGRPFVAPRPPRAHAVLAREPGLLPRPLVAPGLPPFDPLVLGPRPSRD